LMTTNTSLKGVTFRHEPGLGGTFVLGKRLVLDLDYSRQYFRTRGLREKQQHGNQLDVRLNHALTRRARQGYIFRYSKLQGKRSATSKITKEDPATETREESPGAFESLTMGSQFSYNLTKLINLSVTFEYAWTDSGVPDSETNNRKRIIAELTRPFFANRVNLGLTYTFEKNDAAIPSSYLSHTLILGVRTTFGAGPKK